MIPALKERIEASPLKKNALAQLLGVEGWKFSKYLNGAPMPAAVEMRLQTIMDGLVDLGLIRTVAEPPERKGFMLRWEAVRFTQTNDVIWRLPGDDWHTEPLPWQDGHSVAEYEWDTTLGGGHTVQKFLRKYLSS